MTIDALRVGWAIAIHRATDGRMVARALTGTGICRACVAVVAIARIVAVEAQIGCLVAKLSRTSRSRGTADAHTTRTLIVGRAELAVVAWTAVEVVLATQGWMARIGRAIVAVITNHRRTTHARSSHTRVTRGADTAVIAWIGVVHVDAAGERVARVVRARVIVAAIQRDRSDATAVGACLVNGACIGVIARNGVVYVLTTRNRIARIGRTDIVVTAIRSGTTVARSAAARVVRRARVSIVARTAIVHMLTTRTRIAGVVGTRIQIIAIRRRTAHAHATGTGIVRRACTAVTARVAVIDVYATLHHVARIGRADVSIVTIQRSPTIAGSTAASIVGRAFIAVIARIGVVHIDATRLRIARIVGTQVSIIAIGRRAAVA